MYRALICCLVLSAAPAHAEVLELFGEAHVGGMGAKGLAGGSKDDAFHAKSPHGTYGVLVGARFLIVHAMIQHHQYAFAKACDTDCAGLTTWTQFGAGISIKNSIGDEPKATKDKPAEPDRRGYFELAGSLAFGVGTGQQVDPPLSNDEITDKGFLVEGRIGFGKRLNKLLDFGVTVPVSWGYFFKSGVDTAANEEANQYRSLQVEALVYLRANIRIF
jgi:hypothetical protein